jgi:hypothetical protein
MVKLLQLQSQKVTFQKVHRKSFVLVRIMVFCVMICNLFYDALNNADCVASDNWVIVSNEMEWMWKKVVMA